MDKDKVEVEWTESYKLISKIQNVGSKEVPVIAVAEKLCAKRNEKVKPLILIYLWEMLMGIGLSAKKNYHDYITCLQKKEVGESWHFAEITLIQYIKKGT